MSLNFAIAIPKAEAENLSNDGAIWVTSPWKPSYLGYIGSIAVRRCQAFGEGTVIRSGRPIEKNNRVEKTSFEAGRY